MKHYTIHIIYEVTKREFHHKQIEGISFKDAMHRYALDNKSIILRGAYRVR